MFLGLVLGVGRRAHGFERFGVLAFGIEQPGGGDLRLDIDLLGPVAILGGDQFVAQLGELCDVRLGGVRITRPRRAERAGKMCDRLHVRQRARAKLKGGGRCPVAALHRIARRRYCERIRSHQECFGEAFDRVHLLDHRFRPRVLPKLQIRIDLIVHRVQLVVIVRGFVRDALRNRV